MRYRILPNTDLRVSAICLGTAPLGTAVDEAEAFQRLDQFLEGGGNFLDTARAYAIWVPDGEGISETIIGKWVKARRCEDSVIVATKGAHPKLTSMDVSRLSKAEIVADCEASLRALQFDTIPLYWLHRDDPSHPISDIMESLESLRCSGKIRYYGFSNWSSDRMEAALAFARERGLTGFVANQPMWSYATLNPDSLSDPTSHAMDSSMMAFHERHEFPAIPYTSQANGLFAKWAQLGLEGLPHALRDKYANENNRSKFTKLTKLSKETGHSISTLALAWLTSHPNFLTVPIVWGNTAQLVEALQTGDVELTRAVWDALA